jgi:hypothetical protein
MEEMTMTGTIKIIYCLRSKN